MWSLTQSPTRHHTDRGAILVWVAMMMTVLLGVGALTIDLGALYAEKRQLQNGADAAALAVAQDCAQGGCGTPIAQAVKYAGLNAKDAVSAVDFVCGSASGAIPGLSACSDPAPAGASGASGWVRVRTSTKEPDGGTKVPFLLAPIMNSLTGATARATAVAAWGPLGAGTVIPLIFLLCEYTATFGGSLIPPVFPTGQNTITFHGDGSRPCKPSPSGQDLPGGFGYLANDNCIATITAGAWGIEPGNSLPKGCDPEAWLNTDVVIAIYDQVSGNGNNSQYHVAGFVGFRLLGYQFQGNNSGPAGFKCIDPNGKPYKNSVVCIFGEFKHVTSDGGGFGGTDFGARVIKMVG